MIILNSNSPTHFSASTGGFSNIDLTICDPKIAPNLQWETLPTLYGSDHFPIKIQNCLQNNEKSIPNKSKWDLKNANWDLFEETLKVANLEINEEEEINKTWEEFLNIITETAQSTIGIKNHHERRKTTPWWNKNCSQAI